MPEFPEGGYHDERHHDADPMGLPLTIVPWVAGIYRLIDMPNTMLNVTGDTVGMVTVSAMMGDLDRDKFNADHGAEEETAEASSTEHSEQ